MIRQLYL